MNEKEPRYVPYKEWKIFLTNHWRHMNWKVNGLIGVVIAILAFVAAIFTLVTMLAFGG